MPSRAVTMTCQASPTDLGVPESPLHSRRICEGTRWEGPAASGSQAGSPGHQVVLVFNVHLVANIKN